MKSVRISADLIAPEEGGYTVYCPELDIYTQGENEQECIDNLREAAQLHLEEVGQGFRPRAVIRRELDIEAHA